MKHLQPATVLIVIMFVLVACGGQSSSGQQGAETVTVQRKTLRVTVSGSGTVQPAQVANLAFGIGGTVNEVLVEEGERIKQGQVLARLDTRELEANLAAAQAQVDQAQAQLEQARQSPVASDTDISIAEAAVRQAEAQRTVAELNRNKATLHAPFDGIVTMVNLHAGDSLPPAAANAVPLQLVDASELHVDATINEVDIARVEQGQSTQIFIDALGTEPISGTVTYIAPAATMVQNIASYLVRVDFAEDPANVRVGMSATVEIGVAEKQNVLVVPNSAIRTEGGRRIVRLQRDNSFVDTEVQIGLSNDVETEIINGLNEGDVIAAIGIVYDDPGREA
jgi:RND family efflux transporter MFP subunit